jgi:hypothetical protein
VQRPAQRLHRPGKPDGALVFLPLTECDFLSPRDRSPSTRRAAGDRPYLFGNRDEIVQVGSDFGHKRALARNRWGRTLCRQGKPRDKERHCQNSPQILSLRRGRAASPSPHVPPKAVRYRPRSISIGRGFVFAVRIASSEQGGEGMTFSYSREANSQWRTGSEGMAVPVSYSLFATLSTVGQSGSSSGRTQGSRSAAFFHSAHAGSAMTASI